MSSHRFARFPETGRPTGAKQTSIRSPDNGRDYAQPEQPPGKANRPRSIPRCAACKMHNRLRSYPPASFNTGFQRALARETLSLLCGDSLRKSGSLSTTRPQIRPGNVPCHGNPSEPPDADPQVRWCGRGELITPPTRFGLPCSSRPVDPRNGHPVSTGRLHGLGQSRRSGCPPWGASASG